MDEMAATLGVAFMEETIEQRFRFTWPLICKLACKATCTGLSFEDLCIRALRQQANG